MSWWNPFSDYGATAWAEDVAAAVDQADTWVDSTASARAWSNAEVLEAKSRIDEAADSSSTAGAFWDTLVEIWQEEPYTDAGWAKLTTTFTSAAGTVVSTAAGRDLGSIGAVVSGTASGMASDVADSASWGREYGPYVAGVLVVVFVIVLAIVLGRKAS